MKIGVADPNRFKFSGQLIEHWKKDGHEVLAHIANLKGHAECDVVFYDSASNNVSFYCKSMDRQKKVVVRAIDIENYMNYYKDFVWDKIDWLVFLNKAQKQLLTRHPDFKCPEEKMLIIPPGVNIDVFNIRPGKNDTKKAVFVGRGWIGKNIAGAIDVVYELNKIDPGWELHIRADKYDPRWWKGYCDYRVSQCGFNVYIEPAVDSMADYLSDKSLMIVPSFKEAFSYVAAEAMAMGIPALINNWYGAKEVWPEELIYMTPSEAAQKAQHLLTLPKQTFRDVIIDRGYTEKEMLKKFDKLIYENN